MNQSQFTISSDEIKNFNLYKEDINSSSKCIPFHIFKDFKLSNDLTNRITMNPIISLDTFMQIIYETYKDIRLQDAVLIPTVIVLNEGSLIGVTQPGIYHINFHIEAVVPIKDIHQMEWSYLKKISRSSVAIGYFIHVDNQDIDDPSSREIVIEKRKEIINEMREKIKLHGNLEDEVTIYPIDSSTTGLSCIQWIKRQYTNDFPEWRGEE
ncbi:hypothetical protein [Pontibacillus salipaludis]|uniref:hypothetical protein n=1 Tax=Pontibacillus salipaludis TaxID=1697394 RepID=UPI0031E5D941